MFTDATANRFYTEDEIHPAYHDNPVTVSIQDDPDFRSFDAFLEPPDSYDDFSDQKLKQHIQSLKDSRDEKIAWDIEDAEDNASGRITLPADWTPYQESPTFIQRTGLLQLAETIQAQRT